MAIPTAQAISLHCTRGSSDKFYNMQLIPAPGGTWSVVAQHGRRGAKGTRVIKVENVTYRAACEAWDEVMDEKLSTKKGYYKVALTGESAKPLPKPPSNWSWPATWPGATDDLADVCTEMGVSAAMLNEPGNELTQAAFILLADLSCSLQDGCQEAVVLCDRGPTKVLGSRLLSPACQAWFEAIPASSQLKLTDLLASLQPKTF